MKFPLAHRIAIPRPYVRSEATDIRKTIKAERARLKEKAVCVSLRGPVVKLRKVAK